MKEVVFIGSPKNGFKCGKLSSARYLPAFARVAQERGYTVTIYEKPPDYATNLAKHHGAIVVLVYSEEWIQHPRCEAMVRDIEEMAIEQGHASMIIHGHLSGLVIGNKVRTHQALTKAGVPMPKWVTEHRCEVPTFSNVRVGSGNAVYSLKEGEAVDHARYNTQLIDTRFEFHGNTYYVCLRAMCVGREMLSLAVRCRPVDDNNLSVHARNTPVEEGLLNHLYATIAMPKYDHLRNMCRKAGGALGLGFYCHDILPRQDGAMFLCESGFKFDDPALRWHLVSIGNNLCSSDQWNGTFEFKSAHSFFNQLPK